MNWIPNAGKRKRLVWYLLGLLGALLLLSVVKGCWHKAPPSDVYQVGKPAAAVAGLVKQEIHPQKVKALPKKQAANKLALPADVADDDRQEIIDTADVPPAPHGATTVTVLDTTTGEAKTLVKIKPRPFVEILTETAVGVRYGVTSKGAQAVDAYARRDLLRVGSARLAVYGDVRTTVTDPKPEARAMVDLSMHWQ